MSKLRQGMVDAVVKNDCIRLQKLLDRGWDVKATNERGETAFSYACANDSFDAAKMLYLHGADVNSIDIDNGSPLDWAWDWASPEFYKWLVSVGAKHNDCTSPVPWS